MILKTVHIKNFKCITDSNEFRVEENVTCLIGKNESGKTAILQALGKLNPFEVGSAKFNILEYPRHAVSEYKRQAAENPAEALITTWALSEAESKLLEDLIGSIASQISTVTISKGYDNRVVCDIGLDEAAIVQSILDAQELSASERASLDGAGDLRSLRKQLHSLQNLTQRQRGLQDHLNSCFGDRMAKEVVGDTLRARLPKFAYFSEYLQLPAQISVDDLQARMAGNNLLESDKVFLAFLQMIGRELKDLEDVDQYDMLEAELEDASNRLTKEILRYWSQNPHLRVQFRFRQAMPGDPPPFNKGFILRIRIENTRHGTTTSFDERGAGFVWFFSFLGWFNLLKLNKGQEMIFLLDEPGPGLHALAQADLLRYFEERLAVNYQVVYTTHSPFMIDPSNLHRVRTVEDRLVDPKLAGMALENRESGTQVGENLLNADRDTIFPLQAVIKDFTALLKASSAARPVRVLSASRAVPPAAKSSVLSRSSVSDEMPAPAVQVIENPVMVQAPPEPVSTGEEQAANMVNRGVTLAELNRDGEAIALFDHVLESFGDSGDPMLSEHLAKAIVNKGISLSNLGRNSEALEVFEDAQRRFESATESAVVNQMAVAMVNRGVILDRLNRSNDAIQVWEEVAGQFSHSKDPALRESVALSLQNKGDILSKQEQNSSAVAAYDQLIAMFGEDIETTMRRQVATALKNKGSSMGQLGRTEDEIAAYNEVARRYGEDSDPALRKKVVGALVDKAVALGHHNQTESALAVCDDVMRKYSEPADPNLAEEIAFALVNKAVILSQLNRGKEVLRVCEDVARRYGNSADPLLQEQVERARELAGRHRGRGVLGWLK